jgi:predicted phosphoadenosine phosphosulfate sulfurtransferase
MYQAGVPPRYMRICEPFGPEQRQGLWLYHVLEPERWAAMCDASAACAAAASTPGRTTTFMATAKSSNPITSAGANTPCPARQHAAKHG